MISPSSCVCIYAFNIFHSCPITEFFYFTDYLNDGMYGSFNCIMFDHQVVCPEVLMKNGVFVYGESLGDDEPQFRASLWGPTCDSIDCISKDIMLPTLEVGDWIFFRNMGAYTITAVSQFTGFRRSSVLYTITEATMGRYSLRNL